MAICQPRAETGWIPRPVFSAGPTAAPTATPAPIAGRHGWSRTIAAVSVPLGPVPDLNRVGSAAPLAGPMREQASDGAMARQARRGVWPVAVSVAVHLGLAAFALQHSPAPLEPTALDGVSVTLVSAADLVSDVPPDLAGATQAPAAPQAPGAPDAADAPLLPPVDATADLRPDAPVAPAAEPSLQADLPPAPPVSAEPPRSVPAESPLAPEAVAPLAKAQPGAPEKPQAKAREKTKATAARTATKRKTTAAKAPAPKGAAIAANGAAAGEGAPVSAKSAGKLQASWGGAIRRAVDRAKRYPASARAARLKGTVTIQLTVNRAGKVIGSAVIGPSGHPVLDQSAIAAATSARGIPAAPGGLEGTSFTFTLKLKFTP